MKFLGEYIERQREWSRRTFGPGRRTEGICKHIESELNEIRESPGNPLEWMDVAILALDGAWRTGMSVEGIITTLQDKQELNFGRKFPFPESEDHMSEHIPGEVIDEVYRGKSSEDPPQ